MNGRAIRSVSKRAAMQGRPSNRSRRVRAWRAKAQEIIDSGDIERLASYGTSAGCQRHGPPIPSVAFWGSSIGPRITSVGIYLSDTNANVVRTFDAAGNATTPTIDDAHGPYAVAVDAAGKIYVTKCRQQLAYDVHGERHGDDSDDHRAQRSARCGRRRRRENLRHEPRQQHPDDLQCGRQCRYAHDNGGVKQSGGCGWIPDDIEKSVIKTSRSH